MGGGMQRRRGRAAVPVVDPGVPEPLGGGHDLAARGLGRPPRARRPRARSDGLAAWAAAVTAVSLAGFVGIGQVLATLADRFGRISVMLVADVVRAAMFAAMLIDLPVGALLVLAFIAGLATPPFEAARSAALPDLVPEHRYGDALALSGVSVQTAMVAGEHARRRTARALGARGALAVNAGSFLVSAVIILRLRSSAAAVSGGPSHTVAGLVAGRRRQPPRRPNGPSRPDHHRADRHPRHRR